MFDGATGTAYGLTREYSGAMRQERRKRNNIGMEGRGPRRCHLLGGGASTFVYRRRWHAVYILSAAAAQDFQLRAAAAGCPETTGAKFTLSVQYINFYNMISRPIGMRVSFTLEIINLQRKLFLLTQINRNSYFALFLSVIFPASGRLTRLKHGG